MKTQQAELSALLASTSEQDFNARIEHFSSILLGRASGKNPVGEGPGAQHDERPFYCFDMFDCHTYLQTILCLALAKSELDFESLFLKLNYLDEKPDYFNRARFVYFQWLPFCVQNGHLLDITKQVAGSDQPLAHSFTRSNYITWRNRLITHAANCTNEQSAVIEDVKRLAKSRYRPMQHRQEYIPMDAFFIMSENKREQINDELLSKIPHGSMIIFRKDLHIHMLLVIRKEEGLMLRHACNVSHRIVERSLRWYFLCSRLYKLFEEISIYSYAPPA